MGKIHLKYVKYGLIGILSLFLLASSPIADLSSPTRDKDPAGKPLYTETHEKRKQAEKHDLDELSAPTHRATYGASAPVAVLAAYSAPANTITIAGNTIGLFTAGAYQNGGALYLPDTGNSVGVYNEKFYYGHNSANVFGALYRVAPGSEFTVNRNGETRVYRVQTAITVEKSTLSSNYALLYGVYNASYAGINYDISLMTCAGTYLGGGDATHRLVVFASRIR